MSLLHIDTLIDMITGWMIGYNEDLASNLDTGVYKILLDLASTLKSMVEARARRLPDLNNELDRQLYSTLLSYAPADAVVTSTERISIRAEFFPN